MPSYVEFKNVKKVYKMGEVSIEALRDVSFEIEKGEICVIVGASGAGKTTLLNILGGMDTLTSGSVTLDGKDISAYSQRELTSYRRYDVGFVFQFYNLVQNLTALENVELAAQLCKDPMEPDKVLDMVGLSDRKANFPAQLSGGEQQRVAIARALAKNHALRRAYGCARLQHGKIRSEAASGLQPHKRDDGRYHHAQPGADRHGGQGDLGQERYDNECHIERTSDSY